MTKKNKSSAKTTVVDTATVVDTTTASTPKWYDYIDQFVYINLDHRTDRNASIIKEMARMKIPVTKFQRIPAVRNDRGAIGCTFSHIKSLQLAIEKKWKNIAILEDDFIFIDSAEKVEQGIRHFFENVVPKVPDWTVVNLSRGASQQMEYVDAETFKPIGTNSGTNQDPLVCKANAISSTSGYIVNHTFYQTLLNNYKEGLVGLMKTYDKPTYALDMYWMSLQRASPSWFIFNPSLGYQYESYSDVEQRVVDYVAFDKSISFENKYYFTVTLKGGLGNQMFQIASGCAIAWMNGMEPVFEKIYESPSVFESRPVYWSSLFKNVPIKKTHEMEKISWIPLQYPTNEYSPIRIPHNKNYRMSAYLQNPRFFEYCNHQILSMFKLPDEQMGELRAIFRNHVLGGQLRPTIMIHVRRGDYTKLSHIHTIQPMDYYTRSMTYLESQIDTHRDVIGYSSSDLVYIVFSDDIDWCKGAFAESASNKQLVFIDESIHRACKSNTLLKDVPIDVCELMLMTLCLHAIICNSTFSWWGAYLNPNPTKLVIAPQKWFEDPAKNKDGLNIVDNRMIVL